MNPNHPTGSSLDETSFDHSVRALHARALKQLSTPTRARLHSARAAATAAPRAARAVLGWATAAGMAGICALAIGLQWGARPGSHPTPATTISAATSDPTDPAADLLATLDENPDFYLWLASSDAVPPPQEL